MRRPHLGWGFLNLLAMNHSLSIPRRTRFLEMLAVSLTALSKFLFMDYLDWRFPFVAVATVGWLVYVLYRGKKDRSLFKYWGFRTDNFKKALYYLFPFAILTVIACFLIGYFQNSLNLTWHLLPILISYPIWGAIQQFLIMALVAGNLQDGWGNQVPKFWIVGLTALLFSLVHSPNFWLMLGTFLIALFYGTIYLRIRNLYALGLFHGWLGALFYYTVVGSDPFQEIFLKMFA